VPALSPAALDPNWALIAAKAALPKISRQSPIDLSPAGVHLYSHPAAAAAATTPRQSLSTQLLVKNLSAPQSVGRSVRPSCGSPIYGCHEITCAACHGRPHANHAAENHSFDLITSS